MPDQASIREDIEGVLRCRRGGSWRELTGHDSYRDAADAVLAVLQADPVGTMRLIGDVREGWLGDNGVVWPGSGLDNPPSDCYVVRPRGEATDA